MTIEEADRVLKARKCLTEIVIPHIDAMRDNHGAMCLNLNQTDQERHDLAVRGAEDLFVVESIEHLIADADALLGAARHRD